MNATTSPMPLSWSMRLLERNLLPDFLVRFGIRRLLKARLAEECQGSLEAQQRHLMKLIARLRRSPDRQHRFWCGHFTSRQAECRTRG